MSDTLLLVLFEYIIYFKTFIAIKLRTAELSVILVLNSTIPSSTLLVKSNVAKKV